MNANKATGRIRIIKCPAGEAPLWVRDTWVGLELPCYPIAGFIPVRGVLSRQGREHSTCGFLVPQKKALDIVRKKSPKAADWWKENGYPKRGVNFVFAQDEAEIVSEVTMQTIRAWPEEGHGNHDVRDRP